MSLKSEAQNMAECLICDDNNMAFCDDLSEFFTDIF